jgi:predicted nucleotide-binding protein (sugar kinase/HSP70/actin superfamily)
MLDGIPVSVLTPSALLGLVVLFFMIGKIVPRLTLLDKQKEADRWHEAYEVEREARAASNAQTKELLEVAKTTNKIVVAMFGTAERIRQSGGAHEVPTQDE